MVDKVTFSEIEDIVIKNLGEIATDTLYRSGSEIDHNNKTEVLLYEQEKAGFINKVGAIFLVAKLLNVFPVIDMELGSLGQLLTSKNGKTLKVVHSLNWTNLSIPKSGVDKDVIYTLVHGAYPNQRLIGFIKSEKADKLKKSINRKDSSFYVVDESHLVGGQDG
jgi:hypothetical protein